METKALIIGGGIAGLTLAGLLGKIGLNSVIIDNGSLVTDDAVEKSSRTVALMNTSLHVLDAIGLKQDIRNIGTQLKQMRLKDDGNPALPIKQVDFPASNIGLSQFGYNVPNLALKQMLQRHVKALKSVTFLPETALDDYHVKDNKVHARLSDGQNVTADIIIGVDGRNSKVRSGAGITVKEHEYGQSAITCVISHSKSHDNTSTEHHRAGGPFTIVPMEGNQSAIVWVEKTDEAARLLALPKDLFVKTIQDNSHSIIGEVKLENNPESWPLKTLRATKLTAPRIAIAAEAAHVMSPIGAQGLNLSLRDIATLAECITDTARVGGDIGSQSTLRAYESRRKMDVLTRVEGIDTFNKAVSNNVALIRMLRRAGLTSLDALPPLKQFIMHQGLAPNMDEGRLMRGEAL